MSSIDSLKLKHQYGSIRHRRGIKKGSIRINTDRCGIDRNQCGSIRINKGLIRIKRSEFVATNSREYNGGRNSIHAGRTGTRVLQTRPQRRWDEGVEFAISLLQQARVQRNSRHVLSIFSVFGRAVNAMRQFSSV